MPEGSWFDSALRQTPGRLTTNGLRGLGRLRADAGRAGSGFARIRVFSKKLLRRGGALWGGFGGAAGKDWPPVSSGMTGMGRGAAPGEGTATHSVGRLRAGFFGRAPGRRSASGRWAGGYFEGWALGGSWFDSALRQTPGRLTTNGSRGLRPIPGRRTTNGSGALRQAQGESVQQGQDKSEEQPGCGGHPRFGLRRHLGYCTLYVDEKQSARRRRPARGRRRRFAGGETNCPGSGESRQAGRHGARRHAPTASPAATVKVRAPVMGHFEL